MPESILFLFRLSFFCLFCTTTMAQQFALQTAPFTSYPSDSRSVNIIDVNQDGWEDIFISNGKKGGQKDFLFLNNGKGEFQLSPLMPLTTALNPSDGASFADINNDGAIDAIVSSWYGAPDVLFVNNKKGALGIDSTAGLVKGSFAETATFGDYNNDSWIDLYITNSGRTKSNFLYENQGDGSFKQIKDYVLTQTQLLSRGANWVDVNGDGLIDLFVCNEEKSVNELYLNHGGGVYESDQKSGLSSTAFSSMTASWGDIDNDGDLDAFIGNSGYFSPQKNQLFRNDEGHFIELKDSPIAKTDNCTFGSAFADFDNDGDLDLAISNGFCKDNLQNQLYENQGDGTFKEVSHLLTVQQATCSFGLAWGDVNNDGFQDLVIANCQNGKADTEKVNTLLLNEGNENHWLKVKLKGTQSNGSAIGAKVKLKAIINGEIVWQMRVVSAQTGYAGQNSLVAHFGLGDAKQIEELWVEWPSGKKQRLERVEVNQKLEIVE